MLHTLTIAQAHAGLRAKKFSAEELVKACCDRVDQTNETLHSVVENNFERALAEAKKLDTTGEFLHPLTGIPYLMKDVYCEPTMTTTGCSNILRNKDYQAPFSGTTIDRLNTVDAIGIGKSNTDEFTMGGSTESSCYGPTRCPWDTDRVAGGSSGGSAAGVAADQCVFALGTDTGGSIRQPASYCSCVGMRNTYGRTSRYGVMSMASSLDTIGALTKTVEDLAIVVEAIAGHDPRDATTSTKPVPAYREHLTGDIKGMKLGMPKEYFADGLDPEVKAAVETAAKRLEEMGAAIHEVSLPHTEYAIAAYYVISPCEVSSNMARYDGIRYGHTEETDCQAEHCRSLIEYYFNVRSRGFGDEVKRRIMIGTFALSSGYYDAYYRQAQKVRTLIKQDFDHAFSEVDALLSPVAPTPAFEVGAHSNDPVAMYLEDAYTTAQVMAGIPCLSVPCGFSDQGLPIGLQIMGPQWGEPTILKLAHAYEQANEWWQKKPEL